MDVIATLVAHGEATEAGEPSQGALDDPAMTTQSLAGVDAASGNAGLDAAGAALAAAASVVVGLVGVKLVGSPPRIETLDPSCTAS